MGYASDVFVQTDWTQLGIVTTVTASLAILGIAFWARTRFPAPLVIAGLLLFGAALGLGAAWIEADYLPRFPSREAGLGPQRLAAVAVLAVLTPLHVRVVLGPLGRKA